MTAAPGRRALLAGALTFAASRALAQPLPIYGPVGGQSLGGGPLVGSNVPLGASLDLSFLNPGILDPRVTFTRASTATYTDGGGVVRTVAANTPRWDYDLVTHALRGVLIEEARTNQCLHSGDASGATWQASNITVTGNQAIAPDGTVSAASAVYPAVSSAGAFAINGAAFNATAAVYTASVYLKGAAGGEQTYLCFTPDGVTYYRTAVTLTTAWQRFAVTSGTLTAAIWYFEIGTDRRDASQASTPAQTIYMWGAQVEQGAFATSLIPTTAAAVTRAVDLASMPLSSWFSGTAGTIEAEALLPNNGNVGYRGIYCLGSGVTNVWVRAFTNAGTANILAGVDLSNVPFGTMTPGTPFKLAETYSPSGTASAMSGVLGGTLATVSTPATYTTLQIGEGVIPPGGNTANGYIRRVRYWPRVLTNAEMQQVTT